MKWLTKEYIYEQAQISDLAALKCSLDHWEQIVEAGYDEFMKAVEQGKVNNGELWCSLCERYFFVACSNCILFKMDNGCSVNDSIHKKVVKARSNKNKKAFDKHAKEMKDLLKRLYERESKMNYLMVDGKKIEISDESAQNIKDRLADKLLRHGDYGISSTGSKYIYIDHNAEKDHAFYESFDWHCTHFSKYIANVTILGNIFDDLKRNSEPLEEFRIKGVYSSCEDLHFGRSSDPRDVIYFSVGKPGQRQKTTHFELNKAIEIHQKLGRIITTAKNEKANSKGS